MSGQSLFEVVLAIGIAALIVLGIVSLSSRTLGNENASTDRTLAARYAQRVSECLRQDRDAGWDTFMDHVVNSTTGCDSFPLPGPQFTAPVLIFICYDNGGSQVNPCVTTGSVVSVEADVEVSWSDGTGTHSAHSVTRLTDWTRQ